MNYTVDSNYNPLVDFGYVHGLYSCICTACLGMFDGEKRAYTCKDCALEMHFNKQAALDATTSLNLTCENCSKDLTQHTLYPARYALELRGVNVNVNTTGMTYAVIVKKPNTVHFCHKKCLAEWVTKS